MLGKCWKRVESVFEVRWADFRDDVNLDRAVGTVVGRELYEEQSVPS